MDDAKVNEVVRTLEKILENSGFAPSRHPPEQLLFRGTGPWEVRALQHARWMCGEILMMPADKLEKKMRWLGFLQGILWVTGVRTVEQSRKDNMPEGEGFRS